MTDRYVEELIEKYRAKGMLIDANLLLVYLIGEFSPDLLSRFDRTASYTIEDFYLLEEIIGMSSRLITTPHVLTEVSNLSGKLKGRLKEEFFHHYGKEIDIFEEEFNPAKDLVAKRYFKSLGLTDTGIIQAASKGYLVLTDDFHLVYALSELGIDAININQLRDVLLTREMKVRKFQGYLKH